MDLAEKFKISYDEQKSQLISSSQYNEVQANG